MRYLSLMCLLVGPLAAAQPDDFRPLVLQGSDTPLLLGADVTAPVCYAWSGSAWSPCPLQIDERALLDRGIAYRQDLNPEFFGVDEVYHYTAPQDYPMPGFAPTVPADPDPAFDGDDELVLMARFFDEAADLAANPPPYAPATVQEVAFEGRYVYLFVPTTPLDQSAGYDLVDYDFTLLAGSFPEDYDFSGDHFNKYKQEPYNHHLGDHLAANPEYSPVETAYYRASFEDRWIQRELQFPDGAGGYGPDVLDRIKVAARPDYTGSRTGCGRSIWTGSAERGTLGIQKDGPLRALRYVQGYNSGGYNHLLYRMYERYVEMEMGHTMHQTPGASMWFDLAPAATGMTYTSNIYPGGVTVDGTPDYATEPEDDIFPDAYIEWDYLIGDQGSMVGVWEASHNLLDPIPRSYYHDDTTPSIQNCTGDGMAYGNFGNTYLEPAATAQGVKMYDTDPRNEEAYFADGTLRFLRVNRRFVPAAPNLPLPEAEALRDRLQAPIQFAVADRPVEAPPPGPDLLAPVLSGAPDGPTFEGTARDSQPNDSGLSTVALADGATNLTLATDSFAPGAASVAFTVTLTDASASGSGSVVATDVAGNESTLPVDLAPAAATTDLAAEAAYTYATADDGTVTVTARNAGQTTLPNVRVVLKGTSAVTVTPDVIPLGALAPGASAEAFFSFENAATGAEALFQAQDLVVRRGEDDLDNNEVTVVLSTDAGDTAPPLVTGAVESSGDARSFVGSANETRPADTGIATVALAAGANNLALRVDAFAPGAASVGFTVTPVDPDASGSGYVVATDVAGNADSLLVALAPPANDTTAPIVTGHYGRRTYEGTATDEGPGDSGLATVALSEDAENLILMVDPFTEGAPSVTFAVTLADLALPGRGSVIATDVAGNQGSTYVEDQGRSRANAGDPASADAGPEQRDPDWGAAEREDDAASDALADLEAATTAGPDRDHLGTAGRTPEPRETSFQGTAEREASGLSADRAAPDTPRDDAASDAERTVSDAERDVAPPGRPETDLDTASLDTTEGALGTTPDVVAEAAPADGALSGRAYPNPFNPTTTLRFHVAAPDDLEVPVHVAVYDLAGRRVAVLHDGPLPGGWQALRLQATGWPSGVYLWRIETDERVETGRLTLLR